MPLWSELVDVVYAVLVCASTALGGSMGWAIAVVSLVARVALLPVTLRLAYRALETRAAVARIEPLLARVRERHRDDPRRAAEETARLYREHGIQLLDAGSLVGTLVQAPIVLGLIGAIRRGLAAGGRFLWIRDLAAPDLGLAVLGAALTAGAALAGPSLPASQRAAAVALPGAVTLIVLARLAAGVSLYTVASGLVGIVQSVLVRRRAARLAAA